MHLKISKQLLAAFIVLLLVTSSVAAQEHVYLPSLGDLPQLNQVEPFAEESHEKSAPSPQTDEIDPDAFKPATDDSLYQDGDGPWAVPPEGGFREQVESAAANAFNANNWYVQNNLGVGTDTPVHRVELNDNVNWVNRLLIRNNSSGGNVSSDVYLTTGTAKGLMIQKFGSGFNKFKWAGIALADYARIRTDTGVKGLIQTTGNGPMFFGTGDKERLRIHANGGMTIRNTNGNFGIKIEEPTWQSLVIEQSQDIGVYVKDSDNLGVYVYQPDNIGVVVYGAGNHGMEIASSGGDGLFVSSPGSGNGVHVWNGDIRISNSGSFIDQDTTLNVPDYVFEEEYPLMPLDELQAFIQTEKHLPNVPSEDEIRAEGLDLSVFHMHLLEKVEELTLYTLQQQDVIETQQAQIDTLMQRLAILEAK